MQLLFNILAIIANGINCLFHLLFSGLKRQVYHYATSHGHKRKLNLYMPGSSKNPAPLILFFHGGGYVGGSKFIIEPGVQRQVKRGYAVASISYSFLKVGPWPLQIHEAKAAIRYLKKNAQTLGIDPDRFIVWGVSAGAHLASMLGATSGTGHLEGDLGNHESDSVVHGAVVWYPPIDMTKIIDPGIPKFVMDKITTQVIGGPLEEYWQVAETLMPLNYIGPHTPPYYILHGDRDRVVPINQSNMLYDAMMAKGLDITYKKVKGFAHADPRFNRKEYIEPIEQFMDGITKFKTVPIQQPVKKIEGIINVRD
ncbi:MAG: alpha/beta hydrolase [Bacteroidia bacterium]|nr:alpha/beta hydrolase [Bacteroidia bacterium]